MKRLVFVAMALVVLFACSSEDDAFVGDDGLPSPVDSSSVEETVIPDPIGLSDTLVSLDAYGDTVTVTTDSAGWELSVITLDGVPFAAGSVAAEAADSGGWMAATYGWLTVRWRERELQVSAGSNQGLGREFELLLKSGESEARLRGTQQSIEAVYDGNWPDMVGLTPRTLVFPADGGLGFASTKEVKWWITDVRVDEESYVLTLNEKSLFLGDRIFDKTMDWLTVSVRGYDIVVEAAPNTTDAMRTFDVCIELGNYFCHLLGYQASTTGLPDGIGADVICLEKNCMTFGADGGEESTTTQSADWRFSEVSLGDDTYTITEEEAASHTVGGVFEMTIGWLTLRKDGCDITVTTEPNSSGGLRRFSATLQADDYSCTLSGWQNPWM